MTVDQTKLAWTGSWVMATAAAAVVSGASDPRLVASLAVVALMPLLLAYRLWPEPARTAAQTPHDAHRTR